MPFRLNDENRRHRAGALLTVLGVVLFILQYMEGAGEAVVYFGVAALFLFLYFRRQGYGFLVPGGILCGVGCGVIFEYFDLRLADPSALGLALGFLLIYVIDRLHRGSAKWWPLVPGGVLFVGAIREGETWVNRLLAEGWPLLLVIAGLLVYFGKLNWGRDREAEGREIPSTESAPAAETKAED